MKALVALWKKYVTPPNYVRATLLAQLLLNNILLALSAADFRGIGIDSPIFYGLNLALFGLGVYGLFRKSKRVTIIYYFLLLVFAVIGSVGFLVAINSYNIYDTKCERGTEYLTRAELDDCPDMLDYLRRRVIRLAVYTALAALWLRPTTNFVLLLIQNKWATQAATVSVQ